jgi:cysteine desulfurase
MSPSLDAASGLPLGPEARRALDAAIDHGWADPARLHRDGRVARQLLDAARAAVATCIGALPQEVVFTASGTDALHAGLLGLARGRRTVGTTVVASAVEHSAVLRAADWVSSGEDPVLVPVNPHAEVEVKALRRAVRSPGVALAAVQHVNHEIGAVQPLDQVHAATREAGVPLLVDACAALGSLPVTPHWDALAGSAHKWGGPAGVGILAVRTGVRWRSPMPTDEAGRWAGFPNVPGAVAAATALEAATAQLGSTSARRARLLATLRERVPSLAPDVLALGRPDSAPHIVCFTILYADGEVLVTELDRAGFAVSSGSACTADTKRPSHVLAAMGAVTHGNLRVSLPPEATQADVAGFLDALPAAIAAARASADRGSA